MALQIRLLGPVEIRVDHEIVTPEAAKRRAVLAGLAIESNRSVSLDRLAEMVWSDAPPASAVANLRSHAAALRRTLGSRLIARRNAYELRLAPQELDATEFRQLAGEGRAALAAGNPVAAVSRLDEALALWRGPAADGLPRGTALDHRWASLDEQRLQIFEELAEARLKLGEHDELRAGLRRLLADHPLRERTWGQLMLALYRCGDIPAALAAYRDARAVLNEQLSIEPGEELQRLHRAMLDRAPELSYAPPPSSQSSPGAAGSQPGRHFGGPAPRELPADLVTFIGRTRELAHVLAAVTGATPAAVVVTGTAGSGKTALVVRAAHAAAAQFPDGQIFVDLGYQPSFTGDEVVARVLRALGVDSVDIPQQASERSARLRSLLAGHRHLIVVDGVTNAAQVRALVPAGPGPALIAVTQRRLRSLDGVRHVMVDGLPADGGRGLLEALTGTERLAGEPAEAAELVGLCAGSPLALRIAASRLAGRPSVSVAAMVDELRDGRRRLDWLTDGDLSVRERLDVGYAAVCGDDEVAAGIVALLGAAPEQATPPDHIATHFDVSTQRVWQALERLLDAHWVCLDEAGRYRLSPMVRDYAAELARPATPPHLHLLTGWHVDPVAVQRGYPQPPLVSQSRQSAAMRPASDGHRANATGGSPGHVRLPLLEVGRARPSHGAAPRVPVLASLVMLLAAAWTTDDEGSNDASQTASPPIATAAATAPAGRPPGNPAVRGRPSTRLPVPGEMAWRATYESDLVATPGRVSQPVQIPVTGAPGEPLSVLVEVQVGNRHTADGLTTVTFAFHGPTSLSEVGYVDRAESDGLTPVDLPGNAVLSVRFRPVQGA